MSTVRQRVVGNNEVPQDGTKADRPTPHVNRTLTEVLQAEAEGTTSQEGVSPAAVVATFQEVTVVYLVVVEVVADDVDSVFRIYLLFMKSLSGGLCKHLFILT